MSSAITVAAPCKVNLTLDVYPPRPDGFHDLDSIVVKLSPADEIEVRIEPAAASTVTLECDDPALPTDSGNLVYRAAKLYVDACKELSVHIVLRKRLPYQAGLGSASSDAAATLRGLQKIAPNPLSEEMIAGFAAQIGSDVSLFLRPGAIRMRGRGEQVSTVFNIPTLHGVLVKPHVGVPTGPAYRLLDAIPDRKPGTATETLLAVLQSTPNDLDAIASALGNDFEAAVLPVFPEVAEAHNAMRDAGALQALLSGSGSGVFGLCRNAEHAETIARTLQSENRFAWVKVAHSCS